MEILKKSLLVLKNLGLGFTIFTLTVLNYNHNGESYIEIWARLLREHNDGLDFIFNLIMLSPALLLYFASEYHPYGLLEKWKKPKFFDNIICHVLSLSVFLAFNKIFFGSFYPLKEESGPKLVIISHIINMIISTFNYLWAVIYDQKYLK